MFHPGPLPLTALELHRTTAGPGRLVIVKSGTRMRKVRGTLRRQDLGPPPVLGSVQVAHTLRVLLMVTLLGSQPATMLIHGTTVTLTGLRAQATPTTIETHSGPTPTRRRCAIDVDDVHAPEIRH